MLPIWAKSGPKCGLLFQASCNSSRSFLSCPFRLRKRHDRSETWEVWATTYLFLTSMFLVASILLSNTITLPFISYRPMYPIALVSFLSSKLIWSSAVFERIAGKYEHILLQQPFLNVDEVILSEAYSRACFLDIISWPGISTSCKVYFSCPKSM